MEDAILVGLNLPNSNNLKESMKELENLAAACDVNVLDTIIQNRESPTANYYVGKGKIEEIKEAVATYDANLVIFDEELSPSHIRNLEEALEIKVIDRTVLILDIFAKRAKTKEAMLQVELAQAKYFLPRIIGSYKYLSRQKSGTGSKGPGEQQLELDRRLLRNKISKLKRDLKDVVKIRRTQRVKRKKKNIQTVALTGYTNSGKSTLMNSIINLSTNSLNKYVFEKDMLFATLETTTRKIHFDNNHQFLLTDTVGFIDKLPHQLIEAFKSTLEEIIEADLIVHVIDISNSSYENQINIVENVLKDIGVKNIPIIYAYNKIDKITETPIISRDPFVIISALNNLGIDKLVLTINKELHKTLNTVNMLIPFTDTKIYSTLKEKANVIDTKYLDNGILIKVELKNSLKNKYIQYIQKIK